MKLSAQEANFVGLFMETLLFGILLVAAGYCLQLLLFQPGQLVPKKARDIKWWAVFVAVLMTVTPMADLALNLRLNMQAFLWTSGQTTTADVLNDSQNWLNVTRYMLYISEVMVADGIMVYRLFVVYGRKWMIRVIIPALFLPAGIAVAITVVVLGVARNEFGGAVLQFINAALLGVDFIFNGYTTSLIVYKLWKIRAAVLGTSVTPDKWLVLIRIIIESGLLYMLSTALVLITAPLGNLGTTMGDAVGQIIAIATILIIIRTQDMLQKVPRVYDSSATSLPPAETPANVDVTPSITGAPTEEVFVLDGGSEKVSEGMIHLGLQAPLVTHLPDDRSSVSSNPSDIFRLR